MKKIGILIGLASTVTMLAFAPDIASNGAPASSTGAPEEGTCGKVGCHDDGTANAGSAIQSFSFNNGVNEYVPGETYTLTVKIEDALVERFGFQLLSLRDQDAANIGEFVITDVARTQVVDNYADPEILDRRYATYLYAGTEPSASGEGEWSVDWKAPNTDVGPITFYFATVSADDDGTDDGDSFYTGSQQVTAAVQSNVAKMDEQVKVKVFPNPVKQLLNIELTEVAESIVLYNVQGKAVKNIGNSAKLNHQIDIAKLDKGNYFLHITSNNSTITKTIVL